MPLGGTDIPPLYARSGIARSAAIRSDYYNACLALTIGGFDYSAQVQKGTLQIVDTLNEQPDTASLVVFVAPPGFGALHMPPTVGQEIIVGSGALNNRFFGGTVVRSEQLSVRKAAYSFWHLDCTDYTWLLNRKLVTKRYAAQSASTIAIDIVSSFAAGFTAANIKPGAPTTPDVLDFKAVRVGDALTRLANLVGWNWYPDYNKDVHFFDTETSQAPNDLTESNLSYDDLAWRPAIDQIRTRVYVEGGGGTTTAPTAVGATSIPVDECAWYSGSGGTVVSGANLITYTGRSATSGAGNLTGVPASGAGSILYALKQGDQVNIWVQCDDAAAQAALAALEGGDGIHEYPIQDGRLSISGATARGNAELALFSTVDYEGEYSSRDKFNHSGKTLTVTLTTRGITGIILQQQVTRKYEAQDRWVYQVQFRRIRRDFFDILRQIQQLSSGAA
jgi:hypothetical protein